MSLRSNLASVLDLAGVHRATLAVRKALHVPVLSVINYHRVNEPARVVPLDDGVLDATPQSFDQQLTILKRHFNVVGLQQVLAYFRGAELPPNPALITFDDGYRDCHDQALPILQRHGLKAVFFIATDYVSSRRLYWWDRVHYLVRQARRPYLRLSYPSPMTLDLEAGRNKAARRLLSTIKHTFDLDLERLLQQVAEAAEVPWSRRLERELADEHVMTWDQVLALQQADMDIGSHTRTHLPLQTLPLERLNQELAGSRRELEERLRVPITSIGYPVGRPVAQFTAIRTALMQAGYELGFTYGTGCQPLWGPLDRLDLCRFSVERHFSAALFRNMLALPFLAWPRSDDMPAAVSLDPSVQALAQGARSPGAREMQAQQSQVGEQVSGAAVSEPDSANDRTAL